VPLPSGWAAGHLCFLELSVNDGSVTITPPSGWTALDSAPVAVGSSQMSVWYRVLQSGDSNPQVGLASSFKCSGITSAYTGVDQGSPIAAVGTRGTRGSSSTSTVAGSVTTTDDNQRVVGFFMEKSSTSSSVTDPSGTTRRAVAFTTGGGAVSALVVDEEIASAGATGTRTAVYNVASSIGYGLLVAIADGAPTPGSVTHAWVGAPTTDGFEVVAKLASATSVRLAVSTSSGMTSPVYTSAEAPDGDGYVRLAITGLAANTQYWWQLADTPTGGSESLIGSVGKAKTFPTGNASFTFAFSACQTNNNPDAEALNDIRAWDPLFFLHTGDLHYRDPTSTDPDVHRGYIEAQILGAGGLAQLLREVPTNYTRSDHDTCGDNSDSNTDVGLASIAAYRQVVPHPPFAAPTDESLHYSFVVGRVRFIVLDIRNYYRSTGADAQSSSKTMLGSAQKQWLKDQLVEDEPVKVIVSDVGWIGAASLSQGADKWWSYDDERTEIGNYIVAQGLADSVVMLTGDNHALLSDDGTNNSWGGFPVWGAAPLANISGGRYLNTYQQKYSPDPQEDVRNYGRVTVTDAGTSITLTYSGWDALNAVERVDGELVVDTTIDAELGAALPAVTGAAAGSVIVDGGLAAALPALAGSGQATVTVSSAIAAALPTVGAAVVGDVAAAGAFDAALPTLAASAQTVASVSGQAVATLPSLTAAVPVAVTATGQADSSLPPLGAAAAGAVTVSGDTAGVLPSLAGALAGAAAVSGAVSPDLPPLGGAVAGAATVTGQCPASLPPLQAELTGAADSQSGVIAAVLPAVTASAAGVVQVAGQLGSTLPGLAGALDGAVSLDGTFSSTLPALSAQAAGEASTDGAVTATLPAITTDLDVQAAAEAILGVELPALGAAIAGAVETAGGELAAVLPPIVGEATGQASIVGQAATNLPPLAASLAASVTAGGPISVGMPMLGGSFQGAVLWPAGTVDTALPVLAAALAGVSEAGDAPELAAHVGSPTLTWVTSSPHVKWDVGSPTLSGTS
jgi:phosphodiesterase/alkaline phosphatase D-like protein